MTPELWQPHEIKTGRTLSWKIGEAIFHVRHTGPEWQVARQAIRTPDNAIVWKRWTTGTETRIVEPVPVMPDRSVIVRPEAPIHLAPGHTALFYVSVPLWVRLIGGAQRERILCDEPAIILSSIWYGEPTGGELCYSLRTRARRDDVGEAAGDDTHRAVCKLTMRNAAVNPIEFQRLCLPAEHLHVYRAPRHLWTDSVTVVYESETLNRVTIAGRPAEATGDEPLGPARKPTSEGHLLQRSFGALKSFFG